MGRRTQLYTIMPWTGGVNTSVDAGVLNPQELVQADNVVFSSTGARIKREALEYLDSAVPTPAFRSSSGTTRTLKFAANELVDGTDEKLVVGERITVTGLANYNVIRAKILTRTDTGGGVYTITYTGGSSLNEAETAAGGITVARSSKLVGIHDYWRFDTNNSDVQLLVYANEEGQLFYLDSSNNRVQIQPDTGVTTPTLTCRAVRFLTFNENLLIFFPNEGDTPCKWNPDTDAQYQDLAANAPDASFGFIHLGRVWTDDKTNKSRLHFSETFDETIWLGVGDSGAVDVWPGDGDPEGINCAYPYKGFLMIGKKARRYRLTGDAPENFFVELVSSGMGTEGPMAIPVDESDLVFMSRRGVHSQQVTDSYGDTDAAYLSADIKSTFNSWAPTLLKYSQGAYIPELNSIAISVAEQSQSDQNAVWLYNFEVQVPEKQRPGAWYRWPDLSCTALSRRYVSGVYKLIFGTTDGRIIQAQVTNEYADFGTDGILYTVKTGTIYPGGNPSTMKAFKKISMIFRPRGNFSFTVTAKVDNQTSQSFSFDQASGLDLLGETFVLGTSELGASEVFAPYTFTMEGLGRGVVLTITQPDADEQIELYGLSIEYEDVDLDQAGH
jgi:hypothetical protein